MDTHATVPVVADAPLPSASRACALVCANLRLVAAGLSLGTARSISMGRLALGCNLHRRKDCLPHFTFLSLPGLSHQWRRGGRLLHGGQRLDGSADAPYSGKILGHPGPVDRTGILRGMHRRNRPLAPISRTDLSYARIEVHFAHEERGEYTLSERLIEEPQPTELGDD